MHFTTLLSAVAATAATVSASAITLNANHDESKPLARIINRCDYPVHLWSVFRGDGCPTDEMVTLKTGESYAENYQDPVNGVGVSVKISKTKECKGVDITQLEYYLETSQPAYAMNFLDVSYVDCLGGDCPARKEGYYLKAGDQTGVNTANALNNICPILACTDTATCDTMSYVLPDDVQTKSCNLDQNIDFYLCGGHAPTDESPESSSEQAATPSASSTTTLTTSVSSAADDFSVEAAAVTPAPKAEAAGESNVKTEVVYVTEYVNANRNQHGHGRAHGRRHQPFNA